MKKRLKSLLAITLALILSFGSFTAFAEESNTVEWQFNWFADEYTRFGEATLGKNTVSYSEETNCQYYDFAVTDSGYYSLTFNFDEIYWAGFPASYAKNYASGENYIFSVEDENTVTIISELEAGNTILGVDYYNNEVESSEITIDYLGEAITDLVFDEEKLNDFIDGYDIICKGIDGAMIADFDVVFSSEKSFKLEGVQIGFTCEDFKEGENIVTVDFNEFKKDITVTVHPVEYYVSGAELSNYENYTTIKYDYNNSSNMNYISGESVKLSYANGETFVAVIDYSEGIAVFPNGKEYRVVVDYEYNEEGIIVLAIYVAGSKIKEYECTETEAGLIDNIGSLKNENDWERNDFYGNIVWGINRIIYSGSIISAFEAACEFFFDFFISLSDLSNDLFRNIMYFLKYYLA